MGRPNPNFEKRVRERKKREKREEKARRKAERDAAKKLDPDAAVAGDGAAADPAGDAVEDGARALGGDDVGTPAGDAGLPADPGAVVQGDVPASIDPVDRVPAADDSTERPD